MIWFVEVECHEVGSRLGLGCFVPIPNGSLNPVQNLINSIGKRLIPVCIVIPNVCRFLTIDEQLVSWPETSAGDFTVTLNRIPNRITSIPAFILIVNIAWVVTLRVVIENRTTCVSFPIKPVIVYDPVLRWVQSSC